MAGRERAAASAAVGAARARSAVAAAVAVALALAVGAARPASADTRPSFYLDLGASVSLGVQPTGSTPREAATTEGYADDLVGEQAAAGDPLRLVRLGCPGETTGAMIDGGDRCYRPPETQLAAAVDFLSDHAADPGLVTIDIGFDDVDACLAHETVDESCVNSGLNLVALQLPQILHALRGAAGDDVRLLGVGAYDPFLADARRGPAGQAFAAASEGVIDRLNATLFDDFTDAGIEMVGIASVIAGADPGGDSPTTSPAALAAHTCELTWMCAAHPFGPNIHPNADGYLAIANAIEAKLPRGGW
jgi:lysophospholipase L1-like esterase